MVEKEGWVQLVANLFSPVLTALRNATFAVSVITELIHNNIQTTDNVTSCVSLGIYLVHSLTHSCSRHAVRISRELEITTHALQPARTAWMGQIGGDRSLFHSIHCAK